MLLNWKPTNIQKYKNTPKPKWILAKLAILDLVKYFIKQLTPY
jgi:hypothetical protein